MESFKTFSALKTPELNSITNKLNLLSLMFALKHVKWLYPLTSSVRHFCKNIVIGIFEYGSSTRQNAELTSKKMIFFINLAP